MAYTHYWYRPVGSQISREAWEKICADATALCKAAPCTLLHEYDKPGTAPQIDADTIRFNGKGEEEGHDTFLLERVAPAQPDYRKAEPEIFAFCKTARKPYDFVVCGVLASVAEHDHAVTIHYDGYFEDWEKALNWASRILNRSIQFPVRKEADAAS